jgi:hypothetical protein
MENKQEIKNEELIPEKKIKNNDNYSDIYDNDNDIFENLYNFKEKDYDSDKDENKNINIVINKNKRIINNFKFKSPMRIKNAPIKNLLSFDQFIQEDI